MTKRTAVQTKRLLKWAKELRALRTTKTKEFDMDSWVETLYDHGDGDFETYPNRVDQKPCGFAACAVGWLPHMFKEFKGYQLGEKHPNYPEVVTFFGLTDYEYASIVYPEEYNGVADKYPSGLRPKTVAKRIEDVAKYKFRNSRE